VPSYQIEERDRDERFFFASYTDNLDRSRNPHPTGGVMGTGLAGPGWEWPIRPLTAILMVGRCRNIGSEKISCVITHNMALSVSCCMDSKVSVSDIDRAEKGVLRLRIITAAQLIRPAAFVGAGSCPPYGGIFQSCTLRVRLLYKNMFRAFRVPKN
jgi:hypothetical protein